MAQARIDEVKMSFKVKIMVPALIIVAVSLISWPYLYSQSPLNKQILKHSDISIPTDTKVAAANMITKGASVFKPLMHSEIPSKIDGLEVYPDTLVVPKTQRAVLVAVKCSVATDWFIVNSSNIPVDSLKLPGQPYILVFPNNVDETISVFSYTAINGTPALVKSTIIVGAGQSISGDPVTQSPDPTKTPDPKTDPTKGPVVSIKPLPVGSKVHFTIVHDTVAEKTDSTLSSLVISAVIVKGLEARGHQRWVYDVSSQQDVENIKSRSLNVYVQKLAKLPMFIIQDSAGNVVDYQILQGTPTSILAYVDRVAPQK